MLKKNLKSLRQELGLSLSKFSEKLEIPAMTLSRYERGERMPSAQLFIQLDKKLNVNLNWLVSGEGEMFVNRNTQEACTRSDVESIVKQTLKNEGIIK